MPACFMEQATNDFPILQHADSLRWLLTPPTLPKPKSDKQMGIFCFFSIEECYADLLPSQCLTFLCKCIINVSF
ncbi:hypothetical protein AB3S75_027582 [Citrus x aurantiifolia]